jgi:hypothetical protein
MSMCCWCPSGSLLKGEDDDALEKPDDGQCGPWSFVGQSSRSLGNLAASPGLRDKGRSCFIIICCAAATASGFNLQRRVFSIVHASYHIIGMMVCRSLPRNIAL